MRPNKSLLVWCIVLSAIFPLRVFAQTMVTITVNDGSGSTPLPDAVVRITPLSKTSKDKGSVSLTDRSGHCQVYISGAVVAHVSYLGYQSVLDTFIAAQDRSYHLIKSTANIEDVIVTGQYTPASKKESVYQVDVYTQKEIREKGATNLRELMQGSLDIDVSQDRVFGSGISLLGVSGEGVKILLDGVPLVGRTSGILDISQVSLASIERVEVIKGPMSVIYGPDAMGGVINLISRSSQPEKINLDLKGYYESVGQYNAQLNGGFNLGKSQLFFSGGRNFFAGYSLFDTSRHKDWLPKEQYFGNLKYIFNTGKFKIGFSLSLLRELMLDRGNLQPNTDYAFDIHYLTFRPTGSLFATIPVKDYSKIDLLLAYSGYFQYIDYYQKNLVTLSENLQQGQQGDTSIYHDIVARAIYTLSAPKRRFSFQFGVDIDQEYSHQTLIQDRNQSMGDYAAFGSALFKPIAGLEIQPGLRFGYNTRYQSPLIPSLNVKYSFAKYFSIRASYGMGYRAPSLSELFLSFHDSNHNLNGNPDLKAEKGNTVNLEFEFQRLKGDHFFKVGATGFFNQINNKIDLVALTNLSTSLVTYQYFNINSYTTAGAELLFEYKWKRFSANAGGNVTWSQVSLKDTATAQMVSPSATLKVGYKIPKAEIMVMVAYKYTGRKFLYSLVGTQQNEQGFIYPFHTLDLTLGRNFWKNRIQLTCGAKNLLNVTNVAVNRNGAPIFGHNTDPNSSMMNWGRTYFISLNLHFAK